MSCLVPTLSDGLGPWIHGNTLMPHRVLVFNRCTLDNVIRSTKHGIHLLEGHLLCLRHEEPDKPRKQKVDPCKHVESVEAVVLEENGKELLDNRVDNILGLRAHADGLRADVHGEDFGGKDPDGGTP